MKTAQEQGYIGNPAQLVTLRRVTVDEGRARGTQIIEVVTAGGLSWTSCQTLGWTLASAVTRA